MKVMFEYPIGNETNFSIGMPKDAQVLGVVANDSPFGTTHSLATLVDPEQQEGERLSFFTVIFGEVFDTTGLTYVGALEPGRFLWMKTTRNPVEPE